MLKRIKLWRTELLNWAVTSRNVNFYEEAASSFSKVCYTECICFLERSTWNAWWCYIGVRLKALLWAGRRVECYFYRVECEWEYIEFFCSDRKVWLFLFILGLFLLLWKDMRRKCRNVRVVTFGWCLCT